VATALHPADDDLPIQDRQHLDRPARRHLGLHRFYLHGPRDLLAWLHPGPTLVGLVGVLRMRNLGRTTTWPGC
jgi:hypothetical protein